MPRVPVDMVRRELHTLQRQRGGINKMQCHITHMT
jgi:hypothetical protein